MKISILVIVAFSFIVAVWSLPVTQTLNYESIFNFGDSLSDTGNFLISGDVDSPAIGRPPYGETFFNRSTGRCSDGRLIIDFIAEANRLPYVTPYLQSVLTNSSVSFKKGTNFAVAGATANDFNFLKERGLSVTLLTNKTLDIQLDWFKKLRPSLCKTKPECDQYFKKSLFFMGEIGGNDYNYPLLAFRSYKRAIDLVPFVINKIINVTSALIEEGAVTLVVPGSLPIGCLAVLLERFSDDRGWLYDPRNQCFQPLNSIAKLHNDKLQKGLVILRQKYPHAKIIYADYYGSAMQFFNSPSKYGFTGSVLKACCGGKDGTYNAKPNVRCGGKGSTTCENPSTYANWDGIHLTEAAYRHIAASLISGRFTKPPLDNNYIKPYPSLKSDVYAFGVILLELLTGKVSGDIVCSDPGVVELTEWVVMLVGQNHAAECFDPSIVKSQGSRNASGVLTDVLQVALSCISQAPERPDMKAVCQELFRIVLKRAN